MQTLRKKVLEDNFSERWLPVMSEIQKMGGANATRKQQAAFVDNVLKKVYFEPNHVYDVLSKGYLTPLYAEVTKIFGDSLLKEFGNRKALYDLQRKNSQVDMAKLSGMVHIEAKDFDKRLILIIKTAKRETEL